MAATGLTAHGEGLESWLAHQRAALRAEFLNASTPYVEARANGPVNQAMEAVVRAMPTDAYVRRAWFLYE